MSLLGGLFKVGKFAAGLATGGASDRVLDAVKGKPKKPLVLPPASSGGITAVDSIVTKSGGVTIPTPFGRAGVSGSRTTVYSSARGAGGRRKIRRMNALNPKALSRSIRRVGKFADFAKSVGFTRPPAKLKGFHVTKRKRTCR